MSQPHLRRHVASSALGLSNNEITIALVLLLQAPIEKTLTIRQSRPC